MSDNPTNSEIEGSGMSLNSDGIAGKGSGLCTCDAFTIHASDCPLAESPMTEAERLRDAIATLADEWERRNVWLAWDVRASRGGYRSHNENGAATLRALLRETS